MLSKMEIIVMERVQNLVGESGFCHIILNYYID